MANLFYGVCAESGAADSQKEVIIYNPLHDYIVHGDLLAIYFAKGNTVPAPSIVIQETDFSNEEEDQISLTIDVGTFIKTRNVEAEVDYMWQAGEVCLFVLVSQQDNTDIEQSYTNPSQPVPSANNALYYMLVRGARANSEYYGLTKLFTDNFGQGETYASFDEWLNTEDAPGDKTSAATPYLIKELARRLVGNIQPSPEPEPEPSPGPSPEPEPSPTPTVTSPYIYYEPNSQIGSDITIGTLYIGTETYQIRIPSTSGDYEYTAQFHNNADIVSTQTPGVYAHDRRGMSGYTVGMNFITNVLDDNLYLFKNKPTGIYIADATVSQTNIKSPVEGNLIAKGLLIRNQSNTALNSGFPTDVLNIYGKQIDFYTNDGISRTFIIGYNNNESHYSELKIDAPEYIEDGVSLKNRYEHRLTVKTIRLGRGTNDKNGEGEDVSYSVLNDSTWEHYGKQLAIYVEKGKSTGHQYIKVNLPDYLTPLGIVGYNISYASENSGYHTGSGSNKKYGDPSDPSNQLIWELFLKKGEMSSAIIGYNAKNLNSSAVRYIIDIKLLCEETIW